MIEVGSRVTITSPKGRKLRCHVTVKTIDPPATLFFDRPLPKTIRRGDMMLILVTDGKGNYAHSPLPLVGDTPQMLGIELRKGNHGQSRQV